MKLARPAYAKATARHEVLRLCSGQVSATVKIQRLEQVKLVDIYHFFIYNFKSSLILLRDGSFLFKFDFYGN